MNTTYQDLERHFKTPLQRFQYLNKYSRWSWHKMRRETWTETIERAASFLQELSLEKLSDETYQRIRQFMLEMKAMPSMRLLAMAGEAANRNNISIYNCSYVAVDSIDAMVEALIISMSGCGVGYSVESQYTNKLPKVKPIRNRVSMYKVQDSSQGWADALRYGLETWFHGDDVMFDFSELRPAGSILKVKGGRASGPYALKRCLDFCRDTIRNASGRKLKPIECHDIMCQIGDCAVSGGVRRTALISLFDWDDSEMRNAKKDRFPSIRWNANNSIVWPDDITIDQFAEQFLEMHKSNNGEPGIFNRQSAHNTIPARRKKSDFGMNPCISGNTWVAVADGRGRVRMIDLVKEGKDVDVYTIKDGRLTIRKMRNPRVTGIQKPVYRVSFSDGTFIDVTGNHKFALTNGKEVEAIELNKNDAIVSMACHSYRAKGFSSSRKVDYDSQYSYRMLRLKRWNKSEHRFIYGHHNNINISGLDNQIHHIDFNSLNNDLSNLELLSAKRHSDMHRERMLGEKNPVHNMTNEWRKNLSIAGSGEKNPNFSGVTNEQLKEILQQWILQLGYIPSVNQYKRFAKENQLPVGLSSSYRKELGESRKEILNIIAQSVGVTKSHRTHNVESKTDLPVHFVNGEYYVTKVCEVCKNQFIVSFYKREISCCSTKCGGILSHRTLSTEERTRRINKARKRKKEETRKIQVDVYNDLMYKLGREPKRKEWEKECKENGVSSEIARPSSPFRYWKDLKDEAKATNHRVVDVRFIGYEDVYTGTVDDTHTFFAIGCEARDKNSVTEMRYVLNRQCGEVFLRPMGFCNLSIAIARNDDTLQSLIEKVEIATIIGTIQSMAIDFHGLRPEWKKNCEEERLLGVDITGQMDCPIVQDENVMRCLQRVAIKTNQIYAKELGINQSTAITCAKPSGNSSVLFDCSPGIHPRWSEYYIRNVRIAATSPLFKVLESCNVPINPENGQTRENATTWVIPFPCKSPDGAITRKNRTAIEQCEYWLKVKMNYTEHNPSVTITYNPNELIDLMQWIWNHKDIVSGMSFLPDSDAQYEQMPYVEITKEEYERLNSEFPEIDFSLLENFEKEDRTTVAQEVACTANGCELI